ncbi:MAG TPA: hypothetical protein VFS42_00960 [Burkholderiaceae bacterium]|nr:hypothetical protein [Burkholderiaceae bacterium]
MNTFSRLRRSCTRLALLMSVALLGACGGRLTAENYAKLSTGMPYEEVRKLFGDPASCTDVLGVKSCRWGDERRWVNVNFVADKAVLFMAENVK